MGIPRKEFAAEAGVSERTITDFERGAREPIEATKAAMRGALERRGAEFQPEGGVTLSRAAIEA